MAEELTKKAANMLLNGATLSSEPCPYCKGVRVIKDGHALCISCGREPEKKAIPQLETTSPILKTFEKKLESLSFELEKESDHNKQQEILKSINSLLETIEKYKDKQ
jgi:UPF0148 protein